MENYNAQLTAYNCQSLDDIRQMCTSLVPENYRLKPWTYPGLNHGTNLLSTTDGLNCYMAAYGEMHNRKCKVALQNFPFDSLHGTIEIVDWGCGQGIGACSVIETLKQQNIINWLRKITLIEPSLAALNRAEANVRQLSGRSIMITKIEKYLPSVEQRKAGMTLQRINYRYQNVIHIFSNILDVPGLDLAQIAKMIGVKKVNQFILCVGPLNSVSYRIQRFCSIFGNQRYFSDVSECSYSNLSNGHPFSCQTCCFLYNGESLDFSQIKGITSNDEPLYDDYDRPFQNELSSKLNTLEKTINYPSISEYSSAIQTPTSSFKSLRNLRPILDEHGNPYYIKGDSSIVFKMQDVESLHLYAVKCFLVENDEQVENYELITHELELVNSNYFTPTKFYKKELFVDTCQTEKKELPIVLMDWIDGVTLNDYINKNIHDQLKLSLLSYRFSLLSSWLLDQDFAHGDLQSNNIIIQTDGCIKLVDYDAMFVPSMSKSNARELGNINYNHPRRTCKWFDKNLDDFSIAVILLSLKSISIDPQLFLDYHSRDILLFSSEDYKDIFASEVFKAVESLNDDREIARLLGVFHLALSKFNLCNLPRNLVKILRPSPIFTEKCTGKVFLKRIGNIISIKRDKNGTMFYETDSKQYPKGYVAKTAALQLEREKELGHSLQEAISHLCFSNIHIDHGEIVPTLYIAPNEE